MDAPNSPSPPQPLTPARRCAPRNQISYQGSSSPPAGFALKGSSYVSVHMAFSFRELTWRNPHFSSRLVSLSHVVPRMLVAHVNI